MKTQAEYAEQLKALRTLDDLQQLLSELEETEFCLQTKRRKHNQRLADFRVSPYDHERVEYLIDDGQSSGRCKISNLYRVAQVAR